jgi:2-keto-4-pentenoate hydratase/2-oxohepta-3-ene-1,7-dioic acid hydratase in catechol pathway
VAIRVIVNGPVTADSGTFNLPSTVPESIAYVAQWVPLGPGDEIMSGSPNRFMSVTPGDIVEIRLAGDGSLTNRVI